jgi:hypothetical protein
VYEIAGLLDGMALDVVVGGSAPFAYVVALEFVVELVVVIELVQ